MADEQPREVFPEITESLGLDEALERLTNKPDSSKAITGEAEDAPEGAGQEDDSPDPDMEDEVNDTDQDSPEPEDTDPDQDSDQENPDQDQDSDDQEDNSELNDEFVFTYKDAETGEEIPITAEEAQKGYLRQRAFTKKTQALSKEITDVKAEKTKLLETTTEVSKVLEQLKLAADQSMQEFIGIDWTKLQQEDPLEYQEKAEKYDAIRRQKQAVQEQHQALTAELEREYEAAFNEAKQAEYVKLVELAPEFDKDNGGSDFLKSLHTYAGQYGFTADELSGVIDHRMLLILKDAAAYSDLSKKVRTGKEKLRTEKTLKPGKKPSTSASRKRDTARERMVKTNSFEDALEFLSARGN